MTATILNAFNSIFEQNGELLKASNRADKLKTVTNNDLHLAVVVILVDLASTDSNFDSREYMTICVGMQRLFGISQSAVSALISQANQILTTMRGVDRFATLLKEQIDIEKRKQIMQVIDNVIAADGHTDDFEIYLKHKFGSLLGLDEKTS